MQSEIIQKKEELFDNPMDLFSSWFSLAKQSELPKPDAFCLCSMGDNGFPRGRTVLLKKITDEAFYFFTNYESDKAREFAINPKVSVTFYWDEPMDCQVRIEGKIDKAEKEVSDDYFASRPRGSQIGAWASPQSQELGSRESLEALVKDTEERFAGDDKVPRPEFWGGYKIIPSRFDFMLMRKDRLHDRYEYRLKAGQWERVRIAP